MASYSDHSLESPPGAICAGKAVVGEGHERGGLPMGREQEGTGGEVAGGGGSSGNGTGSYPHLSKPLHPFTLDGYTPLSQTYGGERANRQPATG